MDLTPRYDDWDKDFDELDFKKPEPERGLKVTTIDWIGSLV